MKDETSTVYLYDTLDTKDGVECTCTLYWIYHRNVPANLIQSASSRYIPKCIKDLASAGQLSQRLEACQRTLGDPRDYCRHGPASTSTLGADMNVVEFLVFSLISLLLFTFIFLKRVLNQKPNLLAHQSQPPAIN